MPNWRQVADRLASRLVYHAFCEQHPLGDHPDDCPFCQDIAAYEAYLKAGGHVVLPEVHGRPVKISDLPGRPVLQLPPHQAAASRRRRKETP